MHDPVLLSGPRGATFLFISLMAFTGCSDEHAASQTTDNELTVTRDDSPPMLTESELEVVTPEPPVSPETPPTHPNAPPPSFWQSHPPIAVGGKYGLNQSECRAEGGILRRDESHELVCMLGRVRQAYVCGPEGRSVAILSRGSEFLLWQEGGMYEPVTKSEPTPGFVYRGEHHALHVPASGPERLVSPEGTVNCMTDP